MKEILITLLVVFGIFLAMGLMDLLINRVQELIRRNVLG